MRILIITGNRPHMVYLCKELSKKHNIVACFHFTGDHEVTLTDEEINCKKDKLINRYGKGYVDSHYEAFYPDNCWPEKFSHGYQEADQEYSDSMDYGLISPDIIIKRDDINSNESIQLMKSYNPDVVVCHGGPIYSKKLIDSFKLILNYHSGISPLYNGSDSHMFAYANKHPHLCGGTLMTLNSKIDGGDILAHYLPKLEKHDLPKDIFIKNMIGSFKLYDAFLDYLSNCKVFNRIPQPDTPMFYYNRYEWNLSHIAKVDNNIKKNICSKHIRDEKIIKYWEIMDDDILISTYRKTLIDLILTNTSPIKSSSICQ